MDGCASIVKFYEYFEDAGQDIDYATWVLLPSGVLGIYSKAEGYEAILFYGTAKWNNNVKNFEPFNSHFKVEFIKQS